MNHHNTKYDGSSLPYAVGDRYYAQDLFRDFRYLQQRIGQAMQSAYGTTQFKVSGVVVSQGAGHTLSWTAGYVMCKFNVTVQDPTIAWAVPPSVTTDDLYVPVPLPAVTNKAISGTTNDGATTNYAKIAYVETDGLTRSRAKKAGSYAYTVKPDYVLTTNSTPPTAYETTIATFTTDGATMTFLTQGTSVYKTIQGIGKAADYVVASDDSSARDQAGADLVIPAASDAGAAVNAAFAAITTGRVLMLSGTYNAVTAIIIPVNCQLSGCGYTTIINRAADIAYVVSVSAAYSSLENVLVDGKKATYTGARDGVNGNNVESAFVSRVWSVGSDRYNFYRCNNAEGCYSLNCGNGAAGSAGFYSCQRVINCYAKSGEVHGFSTCDEVSSCEAESNTGMGFTSCTDMASCYSLSNTDTGFYNCDNLSGCRSGGNSTGGFLDCTRVSACVADSNAGANTDGFNSCNDVSGCSASSNGREGFGSCYQISGCRAEANGRYGFSACVDVSSCYAYANTNYGFSGCYRLSSCSAVSNAGAANSGFYSCYSLVTCDATANGQYGFYLCQGMTMCKAASNGTTDIKTCKVDRSAAVAVTADTAASGWNMAGSYA